MKTSVILASRSPRRKALLEQAGLSFVVVPGEIDEDGVPATPPAEYVRILAEEKARDVARRYPDAWVIGADTVVVIDNTLLGKPASPAEAMDMLGRLSGRDHIVYTGFCVFREKHDRALTASVKTRVWFKPLTEPEIRWYISTGEPFDKAGGYAIQGRGTILVKRIEGSYTNVVGLPVCELVDVLTAEGVIGLSPEGGGTLIREKDRL
jgi:septum formation protein